MHHHPIRTLSTEAVASLLGFCSSLAILFSLPPALAAPNPLTNPHFSAAIARMKQQDLPGAIRELTQAIILDPALADAYELRGILYMGEKNYPKAVEDFEQVTRLEPKSADAYINLTKGLLMLKDYPAALKSATTAKQLDPQSQEAAILVYLLQNQGKPIQPFPAPEL